LFGPSVYSGDDVYWFLMRPTTFYGSVVATPLLVLRDYRRGNCGVIDDLNILRD
jgi:hypothetical protein